MSGALDPHTELYRDFLAALAASGGGGGGFAGPGKVTDPTLPAWTWQNQGGAAVIQVSGEVFMTVPSSGTSVRSRLINAVGTPWTVTALLRSRFSAVSTTQYAGIVLRESSTSKLYIYYVSASALLQAVKFTNDTTFSASGAVNLQQPGLAGNWHWLRVSDDGVNLLFSISIDGVNFAQVGSEGRTVFMAAGPNQYGLFGNCDSSAGNFEISFASWLQT